MNCVVEMSVLTAEPFLLEQADTVVARISALDDLDLPFIVSDPNTEGAVVADVPLKMNTPTSGSQTTHSKLHVVIEEPALEQTGGSEVLQYKLEWLK